MALFDFIKKKDETVPLPQEKKSNYEIHSIKVLGAGCATCHRQLENVKEALNNMGLIIEPEYITDFEKIMNYGVMTMPAIVINKKVVSAGKVLNPAEIEKIIEKGDF